MPSLVKNIFLFTVLSIRNDLACFCGLVAGFLSFSEALNLADSSRANKVSNDARAGNIEAAITLEEEDCRFIFEMVSSVLTYNN